MEIDYIEAGDYYIPNLVLQEENREIGYWGMLCRNYLKEYKSSKYQYMLLTGKLDAYLADIDEQARERFDFIEKQLRQAEGVNEELKHRNQMEWLRRANSIRNRVTEIIMNEMIYI